MYQEYIISRKYEHMKEIEIIGVIKKKNSTNKILIIK